MEGWRVIPLRIDDPFYSMAIDEAILKLNSEGRSPNTLRFWRWQPSPFRSGIFKAWSARSTCSPQPNTA